MCQGKHGAEGMEPPGLILLLQYKEFCYLTGFLDVTNNSSEQLIFSKDEALAVVDLRSIGYYKVKQSTIQHHVDHFYAFKPFHVLCEELNNLTNTSKREE